MQTINLLQQMNDFAPASAQFSTLRSTTMTTSEPAMKVLIYGTGSIGAACVYLLSKSVPCENIVAICRSNYAVAKQNGFTINSTTWGNGLVVRPTVVRSVEEALHHKGNGFDYILVTTKATALALGEVHPIYPAVSPHTTIALMQNGIGIEKPFHKAFPENPIISAVLYPALAQTAPAVFSHQLLDRIVLGTFPAEASASHKHTATKLSQMLAEGGAAAEHHDDVQIERWKKVLINASENPICALSRLPDTQFFLSAEGAIDFMKDVMMEIAATARAAGYLDITDDVVDSQLRLLTSRPLPGVAPSMMQDAIAGRQMENDAIIGNVVEIARANGVSTPMLCTLYYLVHGLNVSFKGGVGEVAR